MATRPADILEYEQYLDAQTTGEFVSDHYKGHEEGNGKGRVEMIEKIESLLSLERQKNRNIEESHERIIHDLGKLLVSIDSVISNLKSQSAEQLNRFTKSKSGYIKLFIRIAFFFFAVAIGILLSELHHRIEIRYSCLEDVYKINVHL